MTVQIKTMYNTLIEIEDHRFGQDPLDFRLMVLKVKCDGYLMLGDFYIDYCNIEFMSHSPTPTQVPPQPANRGGMN